METNNDKLDSRKEQMVSYINNKYDDTFTFESVYGGYAGSTTHKIIVSSEKYPGKEISVICNSVDGKDVYSDNYLGIKYEEQTKELIVSVLEECFGDDLFVCYSVDKLASTDGSSNDMTFEEYISEYSSGVSFTAIINYNVNENMQNEIADKLEKSITSKGMCCSGKIYFESTDFDLKTLTDDNYYNTFLKYDKYDCELYFKMESAETITKSDWVINNG